MTALALALLALAQGTEPGAVPQAPTPGLDRPPIEVRSPDGRFVARIDRAAGQERVPANMARFQLTVSEQEAPEKLRELWSCKYAYDASPAHYLLASGGRAFVEVEQHFNSGRDVVAIHARDARHAWNGEALAVPRASLGGTLQERLWLDENRAPSLAWTDGKFGPCLELAFFLRGGLLRRIDAEHGRVQDDEVQQILPSVTPAFQGTAPLASAVPFVQSVEFPRVARAGRELELVLHAHHPTPGWRLLGFGLALEDGVLRLTPISEAPSGIAAQVVSVFDVTARVADLEVGRYRIEVAGWSPGADPATVDVLPRSLLAVLESSGGIAGMSRRVELHEQGLARRSSDRTDAVEWIELSPERLEELRGRLAALPAKDRRARTQGAADLFQHTLGFWSGEQWIRIDVDGEAATALERECIEALSAL